MTKKEIEDCILVANQMEWDELAGIIIDLEIEKEELKIHLTQKELIKYDKLLKIYEDEKYVRAQELSNFHSYY